MARAYDEEEHPLSERGIEQQNERLLRRYRDFRRGADAVAAAWLQAHPEVTAVSLIGSVARAPWKEVPRFGPYRLARCDHCGTRRPSASHRTRSTCSFSSPSLTATSDGCAISTPVPRGRRNAGSQAAGTWRSCASTRGSGCERRAWPKAVQSGCSSDRQICSAARAICHFSRSMLGDGAPDGMRILEHVSRRCWRCPGVSRGASRPHRRCADGRIAGLHSRAVSI